MSDSNAGTRLITPYGILSYPHLLTPLKADVAGKKDKYEATLIFPVGTDLTALKRAALQAATEKFGTTYKGQPITEALKNGTLRWPFRTDWAKKGYPENSVFIACRTTLRPQCILQDKRTVEGAEVEEHFYPGAIVRASVTAFGYDDPKNKGVSFQLNSLQKVRDGERLDSRVNAEDEFDALANEAPAASGAANPIDGLI